MPQAVETGPRSSATSQRRSWCAPHQVTSQFNSPPHRFCRLCQTSDFECTPETHVAEHALELDAYLVAKKREDEQRRLEQLEDQKAEREERDVEIAALLAEGE